jgi:short-subunit dehydrogenase
MMMSKRFADKTVVITGASSGIGAAAAKQFAAEGAKVVLVARSADGLRKVAEEIGKGTTSLVVPTDVTDTESVAVLLERAEQHFGAIHVLVNNAGYNSRGPVEQKPLSELTRIIDLNLKAPITLCRLALPYLRRTGGGAIVNIASLAGRIPVVEEATYSATKFGLRAFSFSLADELRGSGVTVSVVSPGPVDTDFIMSDLDRVPDLVFSQPISSAADVASVILDCADDGRLERVVPRLSGYLTTVGYLMPGASRAVKPLLERKGRLVKERYRGRQRGS